jgi:Raf kinase inhibitor-like YbhB/YbcL family protein
MLNRRAFWVTAAMMLLAAISMAAITSCSSDGGDQESESAAAAEPGAEIGKPKRYELKQAFDLPIEISSEKFSRIRRLPIENTCDSQRYLNQKGVWEAGRNMSPPLKWVGVPDGTVSLALIFDNPDVINEEAEIFNAQVHWVIWNLPADLTELPEHLATTTELAIIGPNVRQGTNDYDITGYTGPCPSMLTMGIAQSGGTYDPMSHIYTGVKVMAQGYMFKIYALDTEIDLPGGATKEQLLEAMEGHIIAGGEVKAEYRPKALMK